MGNNLFEVIEYINDNFRYGSELKKTILENLLIKYPLSEDEINIINNELESLKIKIIESKEKTEDNKLDLEAEIVKDEFDFLDDYEFVDLDTLLDDNNFQEDLLKAKNIIDKSYNLEYIKVYQNNKDNIDIRENALDSLVKANQKLVWKIVLKLQKYSTVSFDINDMYQVGMQGLIKAAKKFDLSFENQFSTYAIPWIKQSIFRNIADYSTTIRVPVHMREKIIKLVKIQNEFYLKNEREASKEELSELLNISLDEVCDLEDYKNLANLKSLDMNIGEEDVSRVVDFIKDENTKSPEEHIEEIYLKYEIKKLFESKLSIKESKVLELRFGLIDNQKYTLEEIGKIENVTRERIRQIEAKALRKLRNPVNKERLKDFYYD